MVFYPHILKDMILAKRSQQQTGIRKQPTFQPIRWPRQTMRHTENYLIVTHVTTTRAPPLAYVIGVTYWLYRFNQEKRSSDSKKNPPLPSLNSKSIRIHIQTRRIEPRDHIELRVNGWQLIPKEVITRTALASVKIAICITARPKSRSSG